MNDAIVYLVPLGRERYELYSEPPDDDMAAAGHRPGFFRQRIHRLRQRWHEAVQAARRGDAAPGLIARMRDWAVCRVSETVAEQRTLWSLRRIASAELCYPSDVSESSATAVRRGLLTRARGHHSRWLIIDSLLFVVSGLFIIVPGPNVLAYYLGLRLIGHFLSWRGARQGLDRTEWHPRPEAALAELGELADQPRESRAPRVQAIASGLNLPRLAAFFDRVAI